AIALNGGSSNIHLTAGTGGIIEQNTNTAGTADLATSGSVNLNTAGTLGATTKPLLFDGTGNPSNIVLGDTVQAANAYFKSLGSALNLGNVTVPTSALHATTTNLNLANSNTLAFQVNSASSFNQVVATGDVFLNGVTLNVTLNYVPAPNDQFV